MGSFLLYFVVAASAQSVPWPDQIRVKDPASLALREIERVDAGVCVAGLQGGAGYVYAQLTAPPNFSLADAAGFACTSKGGGFKCLTSDASVADLSRGSAAAPLYSLFIAEYPTQAVLRTDGPTAEYFLRVALSGFIPVRSNWRTLCEEAFSIFRAGSH